MEDSFYKKTKKSGGEKDFFYQFMSIA